MNNVLIFKFYRDLSMTQEVGVPCGGKDMIHIPTTESHIVLYTSPLIQLDYSSFGQRKIVLIGETSKLGLISKSRIDNIEFYPQLKAKLLKISLNSTKSTFQVKLHISGEEGEIFGFSWFDSFGSNKSKHNSANNSFIEECVIGNTHTALYIINFPFNSESFVECL